MIRVFVLAVIAALFAFVVFMPQPLQRAAADSSADADKSSIGGRNE